jgi:hypothetical protein
MTTNNKQNINKKPFEQGTQRDPRPNRQPNQQQRSAKRPGQGYGEEEIRNPGREPLSPSDKGRNY